jgi:hypothetical protein
MRRQSRWLAISMLFLSSLLSSRAQAEPMYAQKVISVPCTEVKTVATELFRRNELILNMDNCEGCMTGTTGHLEDARGHAISTRAALKHYTDNTKTGGGAAGTWHVRSGLQATAKLRLEANGASACTVSLLFYYLWYADEFRGLLPTDTYQASRPSNLQLEKEYLEVIADKAVTASTSRPH